MGPASLRRAATAQNAEPRRPQALIVPRSRPRPRFYGRGYMIYQGRKKNAPASPLTPSETVTDRATTRDLQMALWRLKRSGLTWQQVGECFGRSRGVAHLIASGRWLPKIEQAEEILSVLPDGIFWHGSAELDDLVLLFLQRGDHLTGRELGRLCGTTDRTIRASIKRLRERAINIKASMAPPRGYWLEREHDRTEGQER